MRARHVRHLLELELRNGLDRILGAVDNRCLDLALAMLDGPIPDPVSELAEACALSPAAPFSSLGEATGLGEVDDDELHTALGWLLERETAIKTALAKRHPQITQTRIAGDIEAEVEQTLGLVQQCREVDQRRYGEADSLLAQST